MTEDIRPTPLDLETFLPYACNQLEAPFDVIVSTRVADDYPNQSDKTNRIKRELSGTACASRALLSTENEKPAPAAARRHGAEPDAVLVTTVLDALGRLTELEFRRTFVPTFILKIINLCIPFQSNLNKITIVSCPIGDNAICEISKFLPESQITELRFDNSPVSRCNYGSLLQYPSRLKRLSLERCRLDDGACAGLAARLARPRAALAALSLASNLVSDAGALALAAMLRSNRQLRYLNLSGNRITDTGALSLLSSLMQFSLTQEEIRTKRLQNIEYLKLYRTIYAKFYTELSTPVTDKTFEDRSSGRKKTAQKRSIMGVPGDVGAEADRRAFALLGPNPCPFSGNDTLYRDNYLHSVGNMSLSYLDLSYNDLSPLSVAKLVAVMRYQQSSPRPPQPGLLRAVVEGNPLPLAGRELQQLQELSDRLMMKGVDATIGKNEKKITRKR